MITAIIAFIVGLLGFGAPNLGAAPQVVKPLQGGTGISTTSAANVGKFLSVSDDSPLTYTFSDPSASSFSTTSSNFWASVGLAFSTTSSNYWETQQAARGADGTFSTTSANYWSTFGLAFSTTSALAHLGTIDKGYFFSTTSANFFASAGLGFSTTSSNYWRSVGLAFSTTSDNYWSSVGLGHSTTSVAYQLSQNITVGNSTSTNTFATLASSTNLFSTFSTTSKLTVTDYASTTALTISGVRSAALITSATGVVSGASATTCTNQFVRSISAVMVGTCETVGAADVSLANLTATDSTLTFSGTYNGSTARTIGINLGNANTWTAGATFNTVGIVVNASSSVTNLNVSVVASTTRLRIPFSSSVYWDALTLSNGTFNFSTSTSAYSTVWSVASSGSMSFGPNSLAPFAQGFYHFTDTAGTKPCLGWIGNDGGDSDWMWCRTANNNATNDDPIGLGVSTASTTVPSTYLLRLYPSGYLGIASTTPSPLWGVSVGTSTMWQQAQIAVGIASSTTNTATVVVNWDNGNQFRHILQQNTLIVLNSTSSNPRDGAKYTLDLCQDGTGSRTVTFGSAAHLVWLTPEGTTTVRATANTMTSIGMTYDGRIGRYLIRATSTTADVRACLP